jgi:hypothetical protein
VAYHYEAQSCQHFRFFKENQMNIQSRTCANCAAFNPAPAVDEPSCGDLILFIERPGTAQELRRSPVATDLCHNHLTHSEDEQETALIEENREQGGMEQAIQAASSISLARAVVHRAMQ